MRIELKLQLYSWRRFQTGPEFVLDFRYLFQRQAITVYPEQPGETVIEVDEVEADLRTSRNGDSHLRRLEHWATYGVQDNIDSLSGRQLQNPLTKISGLGIEQ